MKRDTVQEKLTFYNPGGGIHRLKGGKIVKSHETFKASLNQLSARQRSIFKCLSKGAIDAKVVDVATDVEYISKKRETSNFWDVFRVSDGKRMNEKALREDAAEELKNSL